MKDPQIRYARASDGVKIAFTVSGEGPALVLMPNQISHLLLELEYPGARTLFERLGNGRTLVRYDSRGIGMSQREVADYSLDALTGDLEAVVAAAGLERFALFAAGFQGMAAVMEAYRHPERVSHLILWYACARGSDFWRSPWSQALRAVRETDFEVYAEAVVRMGPAAGVRLTPEEERAAVALVRAGGSASSLKAFMDASMAYDVSDLLPRVTCPTLVVHSRDGGVIDVGAARELAAAIPDARIALIERASIVPWTGDRDVVLETIAGFVPGGRPDVPRALSQLVTILFTDVEGSTALTQRLGDERARDVLRAHERVTREMLRNHGGSEVKTLGDGFMARFGSARGALECAIAIQRAFEALTIDDADRVRVRIGINAGEPIAEEDDFFGTAVIVAARIAACAGGGEVLVSDVVRQLVAGKGFHFVDRGEQKLKGLEDPVRVYEARWTAAS